MAYTEKSIQEALYREYNGRSHKYIVPNSMLFPGSEADLITVTTTGYINEFEIKISLTNWKVDKKKSKFKNYTENYTEKYGSFRGYRIPNYFWYVVPEDLYLSAKDFINTLPNYCGLIIIVGCGYPRIIKRAKILHKQKINSYQKDKLTNSLSYRYWNLRLKEK